MVVAAIQCIFVACNVCRVNGIYDLPEDASWEGDQADWAALPCFFTHGCIGHVWPEATN